MDTAEITNALLRELETKDVLELSPDFYERACKHLETLREKGSSDVFARYEAELLQKTLEKLYLLRVEKIITHMIRTGEKPGVSLPEVERRVVEAVSGFLAVLRGEEKVEEEVKEKRRVRLKDGVLVIFLKPYSRILLEQGVSLGPFSRGDLAFLPKGLAKELSAKGVVELFEELKSR